MPILNVQEGRKHLPDVFTDLLRVVDGQNRVPYSSLVRDYANSVNTSRSTHPSQQNRPSPMRPVFTGLALRGGGGNAYFLLADITLMGYRTISN